MQDGDRLLFAGEEVEVRHTPGHSPGGLAFVVEDMVFSGDALFAGAIGRTDFPGGDFGQLLESIVTRLLTLPPDTRVFPGHGPPTTIDLERRHNPFLQGFGKSEGEP